MNKQKLSICIILCISFISLFSCKKEEETMCTGKPNVHVSFSGKKRVFVDPNSKAQHVFYTLNASNKSSNQSCTPDSKQCFIEQHVYYCATEDFSTNVIEIETDSPSIAVPSLKADQTLELETKIDFRSTGYYKIEWNVDVINLVDESDENDNKVVVDKFYVTIN